MAESIQLPASIEKCPIIDALIELRFEAKVNPSAVFGMIYSVLMEKYPGNIVNLPILQLCLIRNPEYRSLAVLNPCKNKCL